MMMPQMIAEPLHPKCPNCWKETPLCLCNEIIPISTRKQLLILQHPREAKNSLGTARLTSLALENCVHRVGLSWPSLSKALGHPASPHRWAVLFLGTLKDSKSANPDLPFQILNRDGTRIPAHEIEGIVLLDGNWKQSKTLWWRNPWLLKLHRVILQPQSASRYTSLRRQPRKACLSTIEAAIESLSGLHENARAVESLNTVFTKFLDKTAQR